MIKYSQPRLPMSLVVLWNYLRIDINDIGQNNITTTEHRQQFKHEVIKVSA